MTDFHNDNYSVVTHVGSDSKARIILIINHNLYTDLTLTQCVLDEVQVSASFYQRSSQL